MTEQERLAMLYAKSPRGLCSWDPEIVEIDPASKAKLPAAFVECRVRGPGQYDVWEVGVRLTYQDDDAYRNRLGAPISELRVWFFEGFKDTQRRRVFETLKLRARAAWAVKVEIVYVAPAQTYEQYSMIAEINAEFERQRNGNNAVRKEAGKGTGITAAVGEVVLAGV